MDDLPDCRVTLAGGPGRCFIESLPVLSRRFPNVCRLPRALRIVLESVLRHRHGRLVPDDPDSYELSGSDGVAMGSVQ